MALIIDLLGTPNEQIWPALPRLPVMQRVELRRQPYNNVRSVFKWLNDDGVQLLNAMFMYDPSRCSLGSRRVATT
jgi:cyclin-dependent kinase 10